MAEAGGVKETINYRQLLGLEQPGPFRDPEPSCRYEFAVWQQSKQKNLPLQNYCKSLHFIAFAIRFHCFSFPPACVHVGFYVSLASQQNSCASDGGDQTYPEPQNDVRPVPVHLEQVRAATGGCDCGSATVAAPVPADVPQLVQAACA